MPLRNAAAVAFKPVGVSDVVDGSNGPPGALAAAVNLIHSLHTRSVFTPRPALTQMPAFPGPIGQGEALTEIGDRVWGFVQLPANNFPAGTWNQDLWNTMLWGPEPGNSIPFCYDHLAGDFLPIDGAAPGALPASTSNSGDWIPPTIAQIGAFILFTHPGFELPNAFGWVDMTGFTSTQTGEATVNSKVITNLSADPLQSGWRPGMTVTSPLFPPGTTVVSMTEPGITIPPVTHPTVTVSKPALASGVTQLTIAGGTQDKPLWGAGNLNGYPLPSVPRAVAMFNGRAWFACKNAAVFSDAGDPLERSAADQVVTIQNGLDITAFATQPFANQTTIGGVMQALICFQSDAGIWQITGDAATANLALNFVSDNGTLAPLTIATVPGPALRFVAPDGCRQLNLDGSLSEPLGAQGDGVAQPFIDAPFPSRMVAAFNEDTYRVSVSGYVAVGGSVVPELAAAEFWYVEKLKAWSGPHSCPARLITASNRPATNHGFLLFRLGPSQHVLGSGHGWVLATGAGLMLGTGRPVDYTGLWFSTTRPMINSTWVEDGEPIEWIYQSSLMPDTQAMFMNAILETTVACALQPEQSISIAAIDERGVTLDRVNIKGFAPVPHGTQLPAGMGSLFAQRQVDWHTTLEVKQASLLLRGEANASVAIGNINLRLQRTGYLLQDPGRITTMQPQFGVP